MGRAAKANAQRTAQPVTVTVTEIEYWKLTTLVQDVQLATQEAERVLATVRQQVAAKEAARAEYMATLTKAHPDLDFAATNYRGDAATFTLHPVGDAPPPAAG